MTILAIDGVANVRDVGGMAAAGGRIRPGVLLRSGQLSRASHDGALALAARVARIVDLRASEEVALEPSAIPNTQTTHLPLFLGSVASFFEDDVSLAEMYRRLMDESGDRIVDAIRVIATGGPTLVHCTVGKDRTGVTVALALAAVGADREEIIADYALTESQLPAERNRRIVEFLSSQHPEAKHAIALATQSPAAVMHDVLERVEATWGSAAAYLQHNGLTDAELASLRAVLVDEGDNKG